MIRGKFITFEGGEGCGKSTQAKLLHEYFIKNKIPSVLTREPGGIPEGEAMRSILKNPKYNLTNYAQISLFSASRNMFIERIVRPNLENKINVISDRFTDSTRAYQGYAGGENLEKLEKVIAESTSGISPDITIIIDIDPEIGLQKETENSSFSKRGLEYHRKVRNGYLDIVKNNKNRCYVLPYIQNGIEETHKKIIDIVKNNLQKKYS